ncbi:MAG: amino acid adenylation domain-containing protein [Methylococcaceae bacterium]|nr:amino acid adenylation domain-containing protein [Methylococcaceae bacterium]
MIKSLDSEGINITDILRLRAAQQPHELAYTFLLDGEHQAAHYSYAQLDQRVRHIAAYLQASALPCERAVLLYPPGLDYIAAFFACLYAGLVAVPLYPPKNKRNAPRVLAVLNDCLATVILSTEAIANASLDLLGVSGSDKRSPHWLLTDHLPAGLDGQWQAPTLSLNSLAFLQYTSGSTGQPKGVMVSHGNLMANQKLIKDSFAHDSHTTVVGWLPLYHDMGLIGNIMQPLYLGSRAVLMPPLAFLEKPLRWLQAISDYAAHTSGGPNFAYDYCVQKITPEQRSQLDLSSWQLAFNGSEPVSSASIERFTEAFADCGFRPQAFYPCYGLAEATLLVAGPQHRGLPTVKAFDKTALAKGYACASLSADGRQLVACGRPGADHTLRIVNPDNQHLCALGQIGEIQVAGPSVTQGYWGQGQATAASFFTEHHTYWLRTGDLGFIDQGELYVAGRLKDLIILRGRNHYPQDLEHAALTAVSCLQPGGAAAFSIADDDGEKLVLLAELKRAYLNQPDFRAEFAAIRSCVAYDCEAEIDTVVFLKPGALPKTTSGKIRRSSCKQNYLQALFDVVAIDNMASPSVQTELAFSSADNVTRTALLTALPTDSTALLADYVRTKVAALTGWSLEDIGLAMPIASLGISSLKATELKYAVDDLLNIDLPITLLLAEQCINDIAASALALAQQQSPSPDTASAAAAPVCTNLPLSLGQQAIWTVCQVEPDTLIYHLPIALTLCANIDIDALRAALRQLLARHGQLRVRFRLDAGFAPIQQLSPDTEPALSQSYCQHEPERQSQLRVALRQPLDLNNGPLFKVNVFSLAQNNHIMLFCAHHLIADFHSLGLLLAELKIAYTAQVSGHTAVLPPITARYEDYLYWQQHYLQSTKAEQAKHYWQQQLAGEIPTLALPTDRRLATRQGASVTRLMCREETQLLSALAVQLGTTLYVLLLALFKTLLYRYSGLSDLIVGSPVAGRPSSQFADVVGYFVNPVALRTRPEGKQAFGDYLAAVRETVHAALLHQDYPFPLLVEQLQPERQAGVWPFYQVMFVMQGGAYANQDAAALALAIPHIALDWPLMAAHSTALPEFAAQFGLSLVAAPCDNGLWLSFQYDTGLFERSSITRMHAHFQCLFRAVVRQPSTRLADLPIVSMPESLRIAAWNATQQRYPETALIHQRFEQHAARYPDALALVFAGQTLSYAQLNTQANQLAHALRARGVGPEVLVALCLPRSLRLVVALLAILKAGGAYVPLAVDYPPARLELMLNDIAPRVLLTHTPLLPILQYASSQVLCLDTQWADLGDDHSTNLDLVLHPHNLAYCIYTSGSTGQPKGVAIDHQGILNRLLWMQSEYPLSATDRVLQKTPYSFDVSVWEFFWPLMVGASLVIAQPDEHKDNLALIKLITAQSVTTLHFVPSMLQAFVGTPAAASCKSLLRVFCSGEALSADLVQRYYQQLDAPLHNLYGPTEASVDVTAWACTPNATSTVPPIGRPIANTVIYVLDRHLNAVPIGVVGELCIGGVGLARGYWRQPAKTAEKFIPNPFDAQGGRLYKTGDLAYYRADGALVYVGRNDFQVKLRGIRIELGEIEARLRAIAGIRAAVVVVREDLPGDPRLVAYLLPEPTTDINSAQLPTLLSRHLAAQQIPSAYVVLDAFPVNASGKLDRKKLPPPAYAGISTQQAVAPRDEAEEAVARIWCEVLGISTPSIYDNFFDLGGHSLSAVQVTGRIKAAFGIAVPVKTLFEAPTIAGLVDKLADFGEE